MHIRVTGNYERIFSWGVARSVNQNFRKSNLATGIEFVLRKKSSGRATN